MVTKATRMIDGSAKRQELAKALEAADPYQIAQVFELPALSRSRSSSSSKPGSASKVVFQDDHFGLDWTTVLTCWCDAANAAQAGFPLESYEAQVSLHVAFHQILTASSGNWLIPSLHTICKMTRQRAILADQWEDAQSKKKMQNQLQKAVTLLQESYSKTSNDRKEYKPDAPLDDSEGSKKAGVLWIVTELFRMYFRLNTLRLCKNLLRPIESRNLHQIGSNQSTRVSYNYYVGRLYLFEDQYAMAEERLDYAFQHCHKSSTHNKRCILRYLIPVKLYRGKMPTLKLLEKYNVQEFIPIVDGLRKGDLRSFHDGLMKHQDLFIQRGTYLLLEKLKTVCYRNLFRRIHKILDKHQISLNHIAKTLKWLDIAMVDLDEVECILANLIFRGYVRGYLSHAKRVLVLSKRDPFPMSAIVMKSS